MADVRGDVLRPPHCTTPSAVKANKKKMSSFKSNENIHKKEDGSYYVVSANKASEVEVVYFICNFITILDQGLVSLWVSIEVPRVTELFPFIRRCDRTRNGVRFPCNKRTQLVSKLYP